MTDTGALVYVVDDDASAREGVAGLIRSAGLMARTFAVRGGISGGPADPTCRVVWCWM